MSITVNPLTLNDRKQWQALYQGYAKFYQVPITDDILDTVWSWIFDDNQDFYCLLAKNENDEAVGLRHFRAMPSPIRGAVVGFLDDLYVLPEARGSGVVDTLFQALKIQANNQDWAFVRWITAENNYRGRAVYDKLSDKTAWVTYQMSV